MLRVGTSGWQYRDWKQAFYDGLPASRWLEAYASVFATVEVNSTFYRLPSEGTLEGWARATPDDFRFAVKASRYLTHVKRLRDPVDPVRRLQKRLRELGGKCGPVLVQLPPSLRRDDHLLDEALRALAAGAPGVRVAFEPRHDSWHDDTVYGLLADHDVALCWWDRAGRRSPLVTTASWIYLRLHEGVASPAPCYGQRALDSWAKLLLERCGRGADGYVYFNNDHRACAPHNALRLAKAAGRRGLVASRAG